MRSGCGPGAVSGADMEIPVVDFGAFSLEQERVSEERLQQLSRELKKAFSEVGFVFLTNTGITEEEVTRVMGASRTFFLQEEELKRPFSRSSSSSLNHGWVPLELESLNPKRPGDLKEAFNVTALLGDIKWPSSGALEPFQEIQTSFFLRCKDLSLRVLRVIAVSLDLDPEVFLSAHRFIGTGKNTSTLRSLYYPPVNHERAKEGQVRCGEHSDYGSLTLLFQGSDGLQVQSRSGTFISAPTIPGAVLINVADLLQRWTGDQLISVVHRVLLPAVGDSSTRQSLAFFVQPDDEAVITCCDGSNKYPPVESRAYLLERYKDTYGRE